MQQRKVRRVRVSVPIIEMILKTAVQDALPEDARVLAVRNDLLSNSFDLVVESESFDPVDEGVEMPLHPQIQTSVSFIDMIRGRKKK